MDARIFLSNAKLSRMWRRPRNDSRAIGPSTPAFIAVLAASLLRERLRPFQVQGIALAFAGLGVMIFLARPESQFRFQASEGALAVIPSAVFSALYAVFGKRYLGRYPPVTL